MKAVSNALLGGARLALLTALLVPALTLCVPGSPLSGQTPVDRAIQEGSRAVEASEAAAPPPVEAGPDLASLGLVPGRPRMTPSRIDEAPEIDGILDDPAWATATLITHFEQESPVEGAPVTEETDVYVAYDSDNLYFGFHVHYSDPSIMRANRVQRDQTGQDDVMSVYFDTFLDQQRGYAFSVNGYGAQTDGIISSGGGGGRGGRGGRGGGGFGGGGGGSGVGGSDRSWDTLFESGGQLVADGYTAELAIPFKSLRYPGASSDGSHRWGLQIVRRIRSKDGETQVWAPMSRDESSFFSQMGVLEGMTDLSTSRNIEVLPTFTAIQYGAISPAAAQFVNQDADPDAGVNLKYGLTSDLTADFTINPDFSQIESDEAQIQVNQRFPLFFGELRPFFLEGAEIFEVPGPVTFVHTRTIVDPDYGAKVSGQLGRFTVGFVTANDRAPGRVDSPDDPAFDQSAQTLIARARYDLYAESNVGVIFTDREFLDSHSRVFGMDSNFRLTPTIAADFKAVGSRYKGLDEAEVSGHMVATRVRQDGRNLSWSAVANQISPEFDTDVGFVRRTDTRTVGGNVAYRFWPESWVINWGPQINVGRTYDYNDTLQDENVNLRMNISFARSINLFTNMQREMERFSDIEFRKKRVFVGGSINTSRSFSIGGNYSAGDQVYYDGPFLGRQVSWRINSNVRPLARLQANIQFERQRFTDPADGNEELFDIRILRGTTNFQFTDRLSVRNITEWNTEGETFSLNFLFQYRVNSGTVFYAGYDDHFQQADLIEGDRDGDGIDEQLFFRTGKRRTNRAFFVKLQYLLRY